MKRKINVWDYAPTILDQLSRGALLTVKAGGKVNTMSIGWAMLGREWNRPLCTVFVRESRYTKQLLEENPEFTVNIPMDAGCKEILGFCGTKSGRDTDKIEALCLTLEEPEVISVPGIRQLPLTLECKVVYQQEQIREAMDEEALSHYPTSPEYPKGDLHTAYYAQIVAAYIIE